MATHIDIPFDLTTPYRFFYICISENDAGGSSSLPGRSTVLTEATPKCETAIKAVGISACVAGGQYGKLEWYSLSSRESAEGHPLDMLLMALNPGHDGAAAVINDRRLLLSLESEKDSFRRHQFFSPTTMLGAARHLEDVPDAVALGGWSKDRSLGDTHIGAGYPGAYALEHSSMKFFGKTVTMFTSSHERSHIMMAVGMAPRDDSPMRAVLVWEGSIGKFYLLDDRYTITLQIPVMGTPGWRYAFLFALADPTFPDAGMWLRHEDSGKLMALAAYGDPNDADEGVIATVDQILTTQEIAPPAPKHEFRDSPVYNAGVESEACKNAAALLSDRIFDVFAAAAREHLPRDIPLHISGGCGLNCDWNVRWRELGQFSSVFVPPCTNDSGSAIGTAIDALATLTGDPYIEWSVYSGLEFEWNCEPEPLKWRRRSLDLDALAHALAEGRVVAWVQGRWEIGPRALGNRSLLAEPFDPQTRDRLNDVKQREGYRPIAPCCRIEDVGAAFDQNFHDPYMLYFRMVKSKELGAITHVDGSARCQTVTREDNERLHDLLSVFSEHYGLGVLCNTSLNFKGRGFINRTSDLAKYCESRGIEDMVVGEEWFQCVEPELLSVAGAEARASSR